MAYHLCTRAFMTTRPSGIEQASKDAICVRFHLICSCPRLRSDILTCWGHLPGNQHLPDGTILRKRILSIGHNLALLRFRNAVIQDAGYQVTTTKEIGVVMGLAGNLDFVAVVICSSIPASLREPIGWRARLLSGPHRRGGDGATKRFTASSDRCNCSGYWRAIRGIKENLG